MMFPLYVGYYLVRQPKNYEFYFINFINLNLSCQLLQSEN